MTEYPIIIEIKKTAKKRSGAKYKNSRMLNYHRYSEHDEVQVAIKVLCKQMGYTGRKRELQAKVLVLDLYHCFKGDKSRYLNFYLNPNFYESVKRYNWFKISYCVVSQIVRRLQNLEYLEVKKGFRDKKTKHTESSKMKADVALIEFLEDHGVRPRMVTTYRDELIILKGKKKVKVNGRWKKLKPKIKYTDNKLTIGLRKVVTDFNRMLSRHHFDIDTFGYTYKRKIKKCYRNDEMRHLPLKLDLANITYKRVFNNGSFEQGGRWYGTWIQGCPESLRQHVMIDGDHVYEFDFSGMHIHLLYSLIGLRLGDKEPYILPKNDEHSKLRRVYKLIMLTAVNCKSDKECVAAVEGELAGEMEQEPDKWPSKIPDLESMLAELKEHHKPIAKFINKSTGLPLQYVDSQIAEQVIIKMTALDIPVICIHDSFLCKVSDTETVHQTMKEAFRDIVSAKLKGTAFSLTLELEDVLTTECKESDEQLPSYKKMTFGKANLVTASLVLKNKYATRRLKLLTGKQEEVNKVVTIRPEVEYY